MDPTPQNEENIIINSGHSLPHIHLLEETYTDHSESLLKFWLKEAREQSQLHYKKGKSFKFKHEVFGLPATLLPLVFTPFSGVFANEEGMQYANVAVLATTGILSGVHNFFDFARKSQKHFEYEAKYADLATTIMVELSKVRDIRIRADRFVEMVQSKIDNFKANAPLL